LHKHKIAFVPGHAFHANGEGKNTLRLNFSHPSIKNIQTGIAELGQCISNFT
jgi:DNA-binding transcriptional MocR family regulator